MKPECIQAVSDALGRQVSTTEANGIEQRIIRAMRTLARKDPNGWKGATPEQRMNAAAKLSADQMVGEALKKKQRAELAIQKQRAAENYVERQVKATGETRLSALSRLMAAKPDDKNNAIGIHEKTEGLRALYSREIADALELVSPKWLGWRRDAQAEEYMIRALWRDPSVPREFLDAAEKVHAVFDAMKKRMNDAGGMIGDLENYDMPHTWSSTKVHRAGREGYVEKMFPLLDRSKYVHEDGKRYSDSEVKEFLGHAYRSIATDGAVNLLNKGQIGRPGGRIKANRGSQERQIHLKDSAAYIEAMKQFSETPVQAAIIGHINRMAKTISTIDTFGPNADHVVSHLINKYEAMDKIDRLDAGKREWEYHTGYSDFLSDLYNGVSGSANNITGPIIRVLQMYKNIKVAAVLGSVPLSSISDNAMMQMTAHVNGVPMWTMMREQLRSFNPANRAEKEAAKAAGMMFREFSEQMTAWGGDVSGHDWSAKFAGSIIRASGLNALNNANRRAMNRSFLSAIGGWLKEFDSMADIDTGHAEYLRSSGITDDSWAVMRGAKFGSDQFGQNYFDASDVMQVPDAHIRSVLAPQLSELNAAIDKQVSNLSSLMGRTKDPDKLAAQQKRLDGLEASRKTGEAELIQRAREDAVVQLMGYITREQDMGVLEPGPRERASMGQLTNKGVGGKLLSFGLMFKSFTWAYTMKHIGRGLARDGFQGKAGYLIGLAALSAMYGAMTLEARNLVTGKDAEIPDSKSFWIRAMLAGGGLGIYGDVLLSNVDDTQSDALSISGGPMISDANNLISGTSDLMSDQHRYRAGARYVRLTKGLVPGSNLWYTKAATDHWLYNQAQEELSPGSLIRAKAAANRKYGTTYWWAPSDEMTLPERSPRVFSAPDR